MPSNPSAAASPAGHSPPWLPRAGLLLMVLVALATRLPFVGHPAADFDEQLYDLIGARLAGGHWPYIGLWDRKPLGLFALFGLAHWLGGSPLGFQLLALIFCLFGGWQVWRLAQRIADPVTAAFAAALYPLLMALMGSHSGQSEVFFMPLAMGMAQLLLAAWDRPGPRAALGLCAGAMALGGLALQVKYTVLPQCLYFGVLALVLLWRKGVALPRLAAASLLFALLGLAPTAFAALLYERQGALEPFVFANFVSIGLRGAMPLWITWSKQLFFALPLVFLALGGAAYALLIRPERRNLHWTLAAGWLAVSLAGLFMSRTVYPYYYAALVPATILVALPMLDCRAPIGRMLLGGTLGGFLLIFNPLHHIAAAREERAALTRIAALLGPDVRQGGLFVYDGPLALYRLTGSPLPTRFVYPDHLNNSLEAKALPVDPGAEVERIFAAKPQALVTTRDTVTVRNADTARIVEREIAAHYTPIADVVFQQRKLELYRRKPESRTP